MNFLVRFLLFFSSIASLSVLNTHEEGKPSSQQKMGKPVFEVKMHADLKFLATEDLFRGEAHCDVARCLSLKRVVDHISKMQHELEEFGFEVKDWGRSQLWEEQEDFRELLLWKRTSPYFLRIG